MRFCRLDDWRKRGGPGRRREDHDNLSLPLANSVLSFGSHCRSKWHRISDSDFRDPMADGAQFRVCAGALSWNRTARAIWFHDTGRLAPCRFKLKTIVNAIGYCAGDKSPAQCFASQRSRLLSASVSMAALDNRKPFRISTRSLRNW